jgi:SAM-dependent methyltransferase
MLTPADVWRIYDDTEHRLTAPLSERMLDLAGLRPGMRVLDLATGRGEPAIRAARRVGPDGRVVGVDVSADMLEMARARAEREGVRNLELRVASAEALAALGQQGFQATLVRWGLMYLDAPVVALAAARRAMVPGGILVAALWAEPDRVPYYALPRRVLERYRPVPPIDPEAPGPFRHADVGRIRADFEAADFDIRHIEEMEVAVMEAATGEALIAWTRAFGLSRLLDELPATVQAAWEADFLRVTKPLRSGGFVRLGGVTRIVVAAALPPACGDAHEGQAGSRLPTGG